MLDVSAYWVGALEVVAKPPTGDRTPPSEDGGLPTSAEGKGGGIPTSPSALLPAARSEGVMLCGGVDLLVDT